MLLEIETDVIGSSSIEKEETFFKKKFNLVKLDYSAELTHALANTTRIKILNFILSKGRTNVGSIYDKLKLEQSVTSQQLSILRSSGVLQSEKIGKYVYVEVVEEVLLKAQKALDNYLSKGN